tara:strand:+ start:172 stop:945 length:774 start_codon:yes stop_codon:yes gene_type:complete
MKLIDTHSHLYSEQFDIDRSQVVKDAISKGIYKILLPNISSIYTKKMLALCEEFPKHCFPMMGLHPCDVTEKNYTSEIEHIEKELEKRKYIAVGEIGIDLHWDKSTLEIQKKAFIYQIKLAKKYHLPIVIHVRNSFSEAINIVESLNDENLMGVFHCFTGDINDAKRVLALEGFYLGIGGVLTFKNSGLSETIQKINLKHLVLETDAPYLTPSPFRGKRNESKYILNVAERLAILHNISIQNVADITTKNAKELFCL